jgi:hypothetical protein
VGTNNVTNTFVLSDATITDPVPSNNTLTHSVSVRGSTRAICNNSALTVPVVECEALSDVYANMNGINWTNKTNWTTNPDVSTWFGVATTAYTDLPFMRYTFDANNADDTSSYSRNGTIV